jgi:putative ABC transport system substrate-binding protein
MAHVTRRDFVTLLGGGAVVWPMAAGAQQQQSERIRRIGVLSVYPESDSEGQARVAAFREALQKLGWTDSRNMQIDYRWGDGATDSERLRAGAAELVAMRPDVIASGGATVAAKNATSTIPVVAISGMLLVSGLVANVPHPGGNITGLVINAGPEIAEKWLEILHEAIPSASRVAFLWNAAVSGPYLSRITAVAGRVRATVLPYGVRSTVDFPIAFDAISKDGADALIVDADALNVAHRREIVSFAAAHRLPTVYGVRDFVRDGGLMSYDAADIKDIWRRAALYVDKILKGAKPADLPVEMPVKYELIINLKTARALDFTVPPTLLARAEEVIE